MGKMAAREARRARRRAPTPTSTASTMTVLAPSTAVVIVGTPSRSYFLGQRDVPFGRGIGPKQAGLVVELP